MGLKIWTPEELKIEREEYNPEKDHLSFKFLAKKILERQEYGKDAIIVVIGERRVGKSNWMLKLIKAYIQARKEQDKDFKWSWSDNFAMTTSMALEKYEKLPEKSFLVCDEAVDVADKSSAITKYQRQLKKLMAKIGQKRLLSVLIIPEVWWLTTSIMNMGTMLVAIAHRFKFLWSYAFYYAKTGNLFVKDKFMLDYIEKLFKAEKSLLKRESIFKEKRVKYGNETIIEKYPAGLFRDLRRIPTFVAMHRFGRADKIFEARYIKNVKLRQMKNIEEEYDFVPRIKYSQLLWKYNTLLYNLRMKAGMSYKQLENLHIDKDGNLLAGVSKIQTTLNRLDVQFSSRLADINEINEEENGEEDEE